MKDELKTKKQLINELAKLRKRLSKLEAPEINRKFEERLLFHKEIIENMAEGVHLVRRSDNVIVYANPKIEEMFGYSPGELAGKHISVINAPTDKSPEEKADEIRKALEKNGRWDGEIFNIRKDGTPFWCSAVVSKFKSHEYGEVWISIHQDITKRKRAEEEIQKLNEELEQRVIERTAQLEEANRKLKESEAKYKSIFSNVSVSILEEDISEVMKAIYDLKEQGVRDFKRYLDKNPDFVRRAVQMVKIIDANDTALRLYGVKNKSELITSLDKIFTPASFEVFKQELIAIVEGRRYFESEDINMNLQGQPFNIWLHVTLPSEKSGSGRRLTTIIDITERKLTAEALKKSEKKYRDMVENINEVIYSADVNGVITYMSPVIEKYGEYSLSEIVGRHFKDFIYPGDMLTAMNHFQKHLSGIHEPFDIRVLTKSGEIKWVIVNSKPILKDREIIGFYGVMTDITERKQMEEVLHNIAQGVSTEIGEAYFQELVQYLAKTLKVACAFVGEMADKENKRVKTIAVYANGKIVENFVYDLANTPCENVIGKNLCSYPQNVREQFPLDHMLKELMAESYIGTPLFDSKGRPSGIITVLDRNPLSNIHFAESILQIFSIRASAEIERKRSEAIRAFLANITEYATDAIVGLDLDTNIISWNRGAEILFGYSAEEIIGIPWSQLIPKEDSENCSERFKKATIEGFVKTVETMKVAKSGKQFPAEMTLTALKDENGKHIGFAIITRDITERKRAEEITKDYSKKLELEVKERTKDLEEAKVFAEIANRVKSDFLANMSHELKTPLNSIIGFSEIMLDGMVGDMTDQQRENLKNIYESGKHLFSLINDILEISRIDAGLTEIESNKFSLRKCCETIMEKFRDKSIKRNIELKVEIEEELKDIVADERKIKYVIFNFLDNAIKFTPDGGSVLLKARQISDFGLRISELKEAGKIFLTENGKFSLTIPQSAIEIAAEDTGIGISPEDQKRLFQPFHQLEPTLTKRYPGIGLGLYLSKRCIELQSGVIWVESETGKGSRFNFAIPIMD